MVVRDVTLIMLTFHASYYRSHARKQIDFDSSEIKNDYKKSVEIWHTDTTINLMNQPPREIAIDFLFGFPVRGRRRSQA